MQFDRSSTLLCAFQTTLGTDGAMSIQIECSIAGHSRYVYSLRCKTSRASLESLTAFSLFQHEGHSQGGILGRYWATYLGGAGKIGRLIGIAPIHHGTTLDGVLVLAKTVGLLGAMGDVLDPVAPALMQQVAGSEFMKKLNNSTDILPGVYQANIATV